MATYKNMHRSFKGSVGNLVGSKWRGKSVLRSRPDSVANPNTEKQQAHRLKFRALSKFLREVQPFLEVGFKGQMVGKSAHNAAMAANLVDGFTGTFPDIVINYPDLLLASGPLKLEKQMSCVNETSLTLNFEWQFLRKRTRANNNDNLMVVVYNLTQEEAVVWKDGPVRTEEAASLELPADYIDDTIHVWAAFTNEAQGYSSISQYMGEFVVV